MDRKGVLIIVIALAIAVSYQLFVVVPRQTELRKKYQEQVDRENQAAAKAVEDAKAAAEAKAKTMPVIIFVTAQLPGANVEAVTAKLVAPIQEEVAKLESYDSVVPIISADGQLKLAVRLKPQTDAVKAKDAVLAALERAKAKLPPEAKVAGAEIETAALNATVGAATGATPDKPTAPTKPAEPAKTVTMTNEAGTVEYLFTEDGGGISTVTLKEHILSKTDAGRNTFVKLNEFGDVPIGAMSQPNGPADPVTTGPKPDLAKAHWKMLPPNTNGRSVSFEYVDSWGFPGVVWNVKITKKFTLAPKFATRREELKGEYLVKLDVTYENLGPVPITPLYYLHVGGASPTTINDQSQYQGFDFWHEGANVFQPVDWYSGGGLIFKNPKRDDYEETANLIRWVGVTSQYFSTILTVPGGDDQSEEEQAKLLGTAAWSHRKEISNDVWVAAGHAANTGSRHIYELSAALELPKTVLLKAGEAGSVVTKSYQIFAGPREYRRLRLQDHNEADILNYGKFLGIIPTAWISKLLLNSMNGLYNIVGHYALAIVLLTIILKAILWPLQSKANRSMKKMAVLGPQMKELQAKYKDEPQKYQQEMGKLFRKAGVNPLSGCWPILIQIPVFMGFYNMLGKAVELRYQGFWWVSDLSAPDTVGHIFGLPINPLPLLMAVTMLAQMKLAPQGGDPAQRKMMMFMPIIFIVMCYNFASALALYWAVQNLISIIQLLVNRAKEASQKQAAMVR